jgi:hypothetical protein
MDEANLQRANLWRAKGTDEQLDMRTSENSVKAKFVCAPVRRAQISRVVALLRVATP